VGTAAVERQRLVGGSAASMNTGSDIESTSMCDSDDDDDDDCSSRLSSTATEQSDVRYARRRRHRHQHRRQPAAVSYLLISLQSVQYAVDHLIFHLNLSFKLNRNLNA